MAKIGHKGHHNDFDVGDAIVQEWLRADATGHVDQTAIQRRLALLLETENGNRLFTVFLDPEPQPGGPKVVYIAVPLPEPAAGQSITDWVNRNYNTPGK